MWCLSRQSHFESTLKEVQNLFQTRKRDDLLIVDFGKLQITFIIGASLMLFFQTEIKKEPSVCKINIKT